MEASTKEFQPRSEEFLKLLSECQAVEASHPEWDHYAEPDGSFNCAPTGAYQEAYRRYMAA